MTITDLIETHLIVSLEEWNAAQAADLLDGFEWEWEGDFEEEEPTPDFVETGGIVIEVWQ